MKLYRGPNIKPKVRYSKIRFRYITFEEKMKMIMQLMTEAQARLEGLSFRLRERSNII